MSAGVFLAIVGAPRVSAADCPPALELTAAPGIATTRASQGSRARLTFIHSRLEIGTRRARWWAGTWGAAYGVAAVAQVSATPFVSSGTRTDLLVGGASAALGTLVRAIAIPRVIRERRRLLGDMRDGGAGCGEVQRAERALLRSAKSETFGRSLPVHLAALGYNLGIGLVLGLWLRRPLSGIRQASIGAIVGQTMLVSQPKTMTRALEAYRDGPRRPTAPSLVPLTVPGGFGLAISHAW